jgi:elongation factor P
MSNLTDIKIGTVVKVANQPYLVLWCQFNRQQMRKPVMRTKLRNLIDNSVLEKTFLAAESFEFADIEKRRSQYLYNDGTSAHFMDNESFEQVEIPTEQIEEALKYLKDDTEVYLTYYEGKVIGVQPPIKASKPPQA